MSQLVFTNPFVSTPPALVGVGNGTLTVDRLTHFTITQSYTAICTAVAPFTVFNIIGSLDGPIGVATVGVQFIDQDLKIFLTINQGPTQFAIGDQFTFSVTQGTDLNQQNIDTYDELPQKNFSAGIFGQNAGDDNFRFRTVALVAHALVQEIEYDSLLPDEDGNAIHIEYYETATPLKANLTVQDLFFEADVAGSLGNNISIEYEQYDPAVYATATLQDLLYIAPTPGTIGNGVSIEYLAGGTAGSEVVMVALNVITVTIESGVSTAQQIKVAIQGTPAAIALVVPFTTGTGLETQTAPDGPVLTAGGLNAVGNAGSEVVSVIADAITVKLESGVSTAAQVKSAIEAFGPAAALVNITISGIASNAQVAPEVQTNLSGGQDSVGGPGLEIVTVSGTDIKVGFQSGVNTANDIIAAILGDAFASALVVPTLASGAIGTEPQSAPATKYLSGGGHSDMWWLNINEITDADNFFDGSGSLTVLDLVAQGDFYSRKNASFKGVVSLDDIHAVGNGSGTSIPNLQAYQRKLVQNSKIFLHTEDNSKVRWNSPNLYFTAPIVIRFEDTGFFNRIIQALSPLSIADGESVYVALNRYATTNVTPVVAATIPEGIDYYRVLTRVGSHIIFGDNTIIGENQVVRIGAAIDLTPQIFTLFESDGQIIYDPSIAGKILWNDQFKFRPLGSSAEVTVYANDITLADDEVAYVLLDDPIVTGIKTVLKAPRSDVLMSRPDVFWLFHRYGSKMNLRFGGELEPGEERHIGDTVSDDIFTFMGSTGETDSTPDYNSYSNTTANVAYVIQGQNLTRSIKKLDEVAIDNVNIRLVEGDEWAWDLATEELSWLAPAYLSIPGLPNARNTIPIASSPIVLNAGEAAYVTPNRTPGIAADLTISIADIASVPRDQDIYIIARRQDNDVVIAEDTLLEDGDSIKIGKGGGGGVGFQEQLVGLSNGVNTFFGPLTYLPTSEDSIFVMIDNTYVDKSFWALNGSNIEFTGALIPQYAQPVHVYYLTQGTPFAPPVAAAGTPIVEYRTITIGEETAKQITLANTPSDPTKVLLDIIGGTAQRYVTDYTVVADTLSWNGLGLDGLLTAGDELRVFYFI